MKIIVLSDSHGDTAGMVEVLERENPERVFHLGDYLRDAQELAWAYPEIPMDFVPGNCDWGTKYPQEIKLKLEGVTMLLCHGHRYGVKSGFGALAWHTREEGAELALFGHTHDACCTRRQGVLLCNPGSCGTGLEPTYAVLTLKSGAYRFEIKPVYEEE